MKVASATLLLRAPKRRRHGAKPSVGTLSVTVTCNGQARINLSAAIYEVARGRHGKLARFGASVRGTAKAKKRLALVLRLSHSALTGLSRKATTSALLSLRATGTGGNATSTLVVGHLRGTG
jgi:hypothetical protein